MSQEVPTTQPRDGLFLDDLQTINHMLETINHVNTKTFIENKINIIAKAPVRYSYGSFPRANRAKLIHNIAIVN